MKPMILAVTFLFLAPVSSWAQGTKPVELRRAITVVGENDLRFAPDLARVTLGVTNTVDKAAGAMQANTNQTEAVLEVLRREGLGGPDLQTARLAVTPIFATRLPSVSPGEAPRIAGYTATNQISVRIRDLGRLGGILDRAIEAGVQEARGLVLEAVQPDAVRDAARTASMQDAKREAELYARAADATLGPVLEITEDGPEPPRASYEQRSSNRAAFAVPVERGETVTVSRVRITWQLLN